jgi:glucose-6-phosphate isomerase
MSAATPVSIDYLTGCMRGEPLRTQAKTLGAMRAAYRDAGAADAVDPGTVIYRVTYWQPVDEGLPGGLFIGSTILEPGKIGDEYFMTQGHFHATRDRAEFYMTLAGKGGLILMEENGTTRWEPMHPGSIHYIPGRVAHRVANTGPDQLSFLGCWPSDAGHDYEAVRRTGFGARLLEVDGRAQLLAGE